jgi:hypothetical protein
MPKTALARQPGDGCPCASGLAVVVVNGYLLIHSPRPKALPSANPAPTRSHLTDASPGSRSFSSDVQGRAKRGFRGFCALFARVLWVLVFPPFCQNFVRFLIKYQAVG